jgi:nucleotide-binding universal stress UspA family protein
MNEPVEAGIRHRIVVGVDDSPGARAALAYALMEAARRQADLQVVAAFAMDQVWVGGAPIDVPDVATVRDDTRGRIEELIRQVRSDAVVTAVPGTADVVVDLVVELGPAAPVLVERSRGADLVIVGSRGRGGLRSAFLGSVALHCVTHAACPVVVVHVGATPEPDAPRVVVGVDGSTASRAALRAAVVESVRRGAHLDVVLCYQVTNYWTDMAAIVVPAEEEIQRELRQQADALVAEALAERPADAPDPHIRIVVAQGAPGDVLLEHGRSADLLVVGSRGHGAFRGLLLGSVALYTAMHAACPVLVVHPPKEHRTESARRPERNFVHVQY